LTQAPDSGYPPAIRRALTFLRQAPLLSLQPGEYPIEGRDMYARVFDLETAAAETLLPEFHRLHIDVQCLIRGEEGIGFAIDSGDNDIAVQWNEQGDTGFYRSARNEVTLLLQPGNFAVFFPHDVHRPGCRVGESAVIRKVVVKIALPLLESDR
jgi:YhcH/YjgK/YiaL family protein